MTDGFRFAMSVAVLLLAMSPLHAEPAAEAAAHHRDLQGEGEGIAIAAVDGGTTTFGHAGRLRADGPAVAADTLFEIGSITKVFTGTLLADAVLKGSASLGDPVSKFLPDDLLAANSPLHRITLLDLATHTSGLPRLPSNLEEGADPLDPYAHYGIARLYEFLKRFEESHLEKPGELGYSNLGMGLLGHLLERISGKAYETLLKETVFDPLGMNDSFVLRKAGDIPADRAARVATGHGGGTAVPHWHIDALAGAGAVVSSTRDLARFAEAHLSGDAPASLRAAMDLAMRPHRGNVGLGWFVVGESLHHDGATGGFRSELRLSLPDKSATIRLMNGTGPSPDSGSEGDFTDLAGYWEGTLDAGAAKLRQVFRISEAGRVVLHSLDQGGVGLPADKAFHESGVFRAVFGGIGGGFEAQVEGGSLVGIWRQGGDLPLVLVRAEAVPPALETALAKRSTGDFSDLSGWWSGYLGGKAGLFVILEIDAIGKTGEARLYSPDQTPVAMPATRLDFAEGRLKLEVAPIGAVYAATLEEDGRLSGAWRQGLLPQPLTLTRSATRPEREK